MSSEQTGSGQGDGRMATSRNDPHDAREVRLSLEELATAGGIAPAWIIERVEAGLIAVEADGEPTRWRFTDLHLTRVRCMVSMERDMDANPELAALVADLIEEVRHLRGRLSGRG